MTTGPSGTIDPPPDDAHAVGAWGAPLRAHRVSTVHLANSSSTRSTGSSAALPHHPHIQHRDPVSSYWYLSAAPELLAHAARLLDDTRAVTR